MDIETVKSTPYEVISDKTLSHQDYLFKLIIIGDTGIFSCCLPRSQPPCFSLFGRCREKLSA